MTAPHDRARRRGPPRDGPMVEVRGLVRDYPAGDDVVHALRGDRPRRRPRRAARGPRPLGQRQDHAAQPARRPGPADRGHACSWTGRRISDLDEAAAAGVRRHTVAFVFQTFGLIPILTAAENVGVPLRLVGADPGERDRRVAELLELVGLEARRAGTGRTSCPAASSSGSRSPGRWPTGPGCCSPTSRPASSTPRPATRSWC